MVDYDRFRDALAAHATRPFKFGEYDCVAFVSAVIREGLGHDLNPFAYHGRREAVTVLRELGGLEAGITAALGEPVEARELQDFDIVLVPTHHGKVCGIAFGNWIVVKGRNAAYQLPQSMAMKVWRGPWGR